MQGVVPFEEMDRPRRNNHTGFSSVLRLSRTPFPSLTSYIAISFCISFIALANIMSVFKSQPEIRTLLREEILNSSLTSTYGKEDLEYLSSLTVVQAVQYIKGNSPLIWVSINTYFAVLALIAKFVTKLTFKELTRQEEVIVRHGFLSFLMFSIVFLSVVAGAHQSHRILPWLVWFGIIGFMTVLHDIAYQRFKFLCFFKWRTPCQSQLLPCIHFEFSFQIGKKARFRIAVVSTSAGSSGGRLSWLCFALFAFSVILIMLVIKFHDQINVSHMLFLLVDASLSLLRSLHGLLRCLSSSERFARNPDAVRHFNYWMDLSVTLATDTIQLFNYIHLMFMSPLGFNITCFFFFYHIKNAYNSIVTTLARHHKHNQIFLHIQSTYPNEMAEERDLCIVCWEKLGLSRRLPCGHQFHDWCLMWWLAQDGSCPTCRRAVSAPPPMNQQPPASPGSTTTFRFGGGFGFLRLPSFSIEFSTGTSALSPFLRRQVQHDDSQLTGMAHQVNEMFPQISIETIIEDLRVTGSTQATIENILEGRVGFMAGILGNDDTRCLWVFNLNCKSLYGIGDADSKYVIRYRHQTSDKRRYTTMNQYILSYGVSLHHP
ncbi:hypothetical protein Y032_0215g2352 [Ancylostoma ceylanicum]|uniref:CUE domain protein n=1 Tax=Ancylostoma ceylanicum TaxID=53326 RepID=A0A016SK58_9BILA|nr:hypothetical protein Y032_0215g2352 [Ancylostoma ceylanicum]